MSFSFPTSHLKAAPLIGVATAREPSGSISATTTLAAPARWNASHIALPMPLAPPVTTTTLPVTCMLAPLRFLSLLRQHHIEDSGIMAGCAKQDEAMPDRILKSQPVPGVEDHAQAIQHAASDDEPQRQTRQRLHDRIVKHHAAPAQSEIEPDGCAVVPSRPRQFQHDTRYGDAPHAD